MDRGPRSAAPWDEQSQGSHEARQSFAPSGNQEDLLKGMNISYLVDITCTLVVLYLKH